MEHSWVWPRRDKSRGYHQLWQMRQLASLAVQLLFPGFHLEHSVYFHPCPILATSGRCMFQGKLRDWHRLMELVLSGPMSVVDSGQASCVVASELKAEAQDIAAGRADDCIRASSIVMPASAVKLCSTLESLSGIWSYRLKDVGSKRLKRRLLPCLRRFWRGR